jgi:hypothetical protein
MLLPANMSDPASFVAQALAVYKQVGGARGPAESRGSTENSNDVSSGESTGGPPGNQSVSLYDSPSQTNRKQAINEGFSLQRHDRGEDPYRFLETR